MPQRSNDFLKEKCPYIRAGTLEPIRIKDILTKTVFCRTPAFYNTRKIHNDIKLSKEAKSIKVVDISLHSLNSLSNFKRSKTYRDEKNYLDFGIVHLWYSF